MKYTRLALLFFVLATASPALADHSDWAEGSSSHNDGANHEYYNAGAILPWNHFMGDWRDAKNIQQGDAAYAAAL